MASIQEVKYKQNGKEQSRFFMSLDKKVVQQLALKKGDQLFFNGEFGDELRFKLNRR